MESARKSINSVIQLCWNVFYNHFSVSSSLRQLIILTKQSLGLRPIHIQIELTIAAANETRNPKWNKYIPIVSHRLYVHWLHLESRNKTRLLHIQVSSTWVGIGNTPYLSLPTVSAWLYCTVYSMLNTCSPPPPWLTARRRLQCARIVMCF